MYLFGSTYTKIGTIQRRVRNTAWPLRKDDTQIREAFHIFPRVSDGQDKTGQDPCYPVPCSLSLSLSLSLSQCNRQGLLLQQATRGCCCSPGLLGCLAGWLAGWLAYHKYNQMESNEICRLESFCLWYCLTLEKHLIKPMG